MTTRTADPRVLPIIVERWSPRAFDASDLPQADLDVILEAASLAPSAYNYQPWRFLYAHRADEALFASFLSPLVEFNQGWAKSASVLLYVISDENMTSAEASNPNHSHSLGQSCTAGDCARLSRPRHDRGRFRQGPRSARRARRLPHRGGRGDRDQDFARRPARVFARTRSAERAQAGERSGVGWQVPLIAGLHV